MPKKQTKPAKKKTTQAQTKPRQLPKPTYQSFRLSKKIKHPAGPLKGSFRLLAFSLSHIWQHKRLFVGIGGIYLLLSLLFVREFSLDSGINELRANLEEIFQGTSARLALGLTLFGVLVESGGSASSPAGSAYGSVLIVLISLATIWGLRQTYAGSKVTAKETFYRGIYPAVPYVLVLAVVVLQLLPAMIGATIYGIVVANGLAVNFGEQAAWLLLFGMLCLLSLYMITSSIFALYIVTLPDMTPMKALKSARELVRYRRWSVMRKIIFVPIALLLIGAVVMLPFLLGATAIADYVFFAISPLGLIATHSYMYSLYRELL